MYIRGEMNSWGCTFMDMHDHSVPTHQYWHAAWLSDTDGASTGQATYFEFKFDANTDGDCDWDAPLELYGDNQTPGDGVAELNGTYDVRISLIQSNEVYMFSFDTDGGGTDRNYAVTRISNIALCGTNFAEPIIDWNPVNPTNDMIQDPSDKKYWYKTVKLTGGQTVKFKFIPNDSWTDPIGNAWSFGNDGAGDGASASSGNAYMREGGNLTYTPTDTGYYQFKFDPTTGVYSIYPADVVLNELMWMGDDDGTSREWVELRNTTANTVSIEGWRLCQYNSGTETEMAIDITGRIEPNGYFLIANNDAANSRLSVDPDIVDTSMELDNTALKVNLYAGEWTTGQSLNPRIDEADDGAGSPLAGQSTAGARWSMERFDPPGDGTEWSSWYTATWATNWDAGANERGTPRAPNRPKRVVDGSTSDWTNVPSSLTNSSVISNEEWVWTDMPDDYRDTSPDYQEEDIRYIKIIGDRKYLYVLMKVKSMDAAGVNRSQLCLTVDSDRDNSDTALNWIGDESAGAGSISLNDYGSFTNRAERMIDLSVDGVYMYTNSGTAWEEIGDDGGLTYLSDSNDLMEAKIPLDRLGVSFVSDTTLRFAFAVFQNNTGNPQSVDHTVDKTTCDAVDIIEPSFQDTGEATSGIASDVMYDSDIDFFVEVPFQGRANEQDVNNQAGDIDGPNNPPEILSLESPASNGSTTSNQPLLVWNKPTDSDGDNILFYHIQIADNENFLIPSHETIVASTNYKVTPALTEGKVYWWRVRSYDSKGQASVWSSDYKFSVTGGAARRVIDGSAGDWVGQIPSDVDSWRISGDSSSGYEWVWKDDEGDRRSVGSYDDDVDLTEFRIIGDRTNGGHLYFMAKFKDLTANNRFNLTIAISTNDSTGLTWFGDDTEASLETGVNADFMLNACFESGGQYFWLYKPGWGEWREPGDEVVHYISVDNDIIEGKICLTNFSIDMDDSPEMTFWVGVGEYGGSGDPDAPDNAVKNAEMANSDILDTITSGNGDSDTDDISDTRMDYWFKLKFNTQGDVIGGTAKGYDGLVQNESTIKSNYPIILFTEIQTSDDDWAELYCVDDGNNGNGVDLKGYSFYAYNLASPFKTISTSCTLKSGEFLVLEFNGIEANDESSAGADGILTLYENLNRLKVGDDQIVLYTPYTNDGIRTIMDAVCWSDGTFAAGEDTDTATVDTAGEWKGANESDCVDSTGSSAGNTLSRIYITNDNNTNSDWHNDSSPTKGYDNRLLVKDNVDNTSAEASRAYNNSIVKALAITIEDPDNDSNEATGDTLNSLIVTNIASTPIQDADWDYTCLYVDGGDSDFDAGIVASDDDTYLGTATYANGKWSFTGLSESIPAGSSSLFYVAIVMSSNITSTRQIQLMVPQNGITLGSTSPTATGPVDSSFSNANTHTNKPGMIIINEIRGATNWAASYRTNQFVEIYNNSSVDMDISGWGIYGDNSDSDTLSYFSGAPWNETQNTIPAGGIGVIFNSVNKGPNAPFDVPESSVVLEPDDGVIGPNGIDVGEVVSILDGTTIVAAYDETRSDYYGGGQSEEKINPMQKDFQLSSTITWNTDNWVVTTVSNINTCGYLNGFRNEEVELTNSPILTISSSNHKVFDITLPDNNGAADILNEMTVAVHTSADATTNDIKLKLWSDAGAGGFQGHGTDTLLGGFSAISNRVWQITGLTANIPINGQRFFVSADLKTNTYTSGRLLKLELRQLDLPSGPYTSPPSVFFDSGAIVASFNSGPVDGVVTNQAFQVIGNYKIYVDDNNNAGDIWTLGAVGNDANDGLTPSTPKLTIANALSTYNLGGGDIIYVDDGTYTANVLLDGSDEGSGGDYLTLTGTGTNSGTETVIYGTGGSYCFDLTNCEWIKVVGFDMRDADTGGDIYGIRLFNTENARIESCQMSSNASLGIKIDQTKDSVISNSYIYDNTGVGIYMATCTNNRIINSEFSNNGNNAIELSVWGMHYNNIIDNCRFIKHPRSIYIDGAQYTKIKNCNFLSNSQDAIHVEKNASNMIITNCEFRNNSAQGIYFTSSSISNKIIDSTFSNNAFSGIELSANGQHDYNTIYNCNLENNSTGIILNSADNNIVRKCQIRNSTTGQGLLIQNANRNRIITNWVSRSGGEGIKMEFASTNNVIIGNEFSTNGNQGIYLVGSLLTSATLINNTIISNKDKGIIIAQGNNCYILSNYCLKNNTYGIQVYNSDNNQLIGNKCYTNGNIGIMIESRSSDNLVSQNRCVSSLWAGIIVANGVGNIIRTNWSGYNTGEGIKVEGNSTNNVLNGNYCMTNNNHGIWIVGAGVTSSTLINNTVFSNRDCGMVIDDAGNNYLYNNKVYANLTNGMVLVGRNNIIDSCHFYTNNKNGILLEGVHQTKFTNCYIYNNLERGIYLGAESRTNSFINTLISNNYMIGFDTWDGASHFGNTIQGCVIRDNAMEGIYFRSDHRNIVRDTKIINNSQVGLKTDNVNNTVISNCFISRSSWPGIYFGASSSTNRILDSVISTNYSLGIELSIYGTHRWNIIKGCTIRSNKNIGVKLFKSYHTTITNCDILENYLQGIYIISNSSTNRIVNSDINDNGQHGIAFENSNPYKNFYIADCNFQRNGTTCIAFERVNYSIISNCNISDNSGFGIYFGMTSSYNRIVDSTVSNNTSSGIMISDNGSHVSNTIMGCSILENQNNQGLHIRNCNNSTVKNNDIYNLSKKTSGDGVAFYNCNNNIFQDNRIIKYNLGLKLDNVTNHHIQNNIIATNNYNGIGGYNAVENNLFQGNIVFSNGNGSGSDSGMVLPAGAVNNRIMKNVFYRNAQDGLNIANGTSGNVVQYNTFALNDVYGVVLDNNVTLKNIITYGNGNRGIYLNGAAHTVTYSCNNDSYDGAVTLGTGCITSDPRFKSTTPGAENFRLQYNSPCQNAAETNSGQQACMGRYTACVIPAYSETNAVTNYNIVFVTSLSNDLWKANDIVTVYFSNANGGASDLGLSAVSVATTGTWNSTFSPVSGDSGAQTMTAQIDSALTEFGIAENINFYAITNGGVATNYAVIVVSDGSSSERIIANDFYIQPLVLTYASNHYVSKLNGNHTYPFNAPLYAATNIQAAVDACETAHRVIIIDNFQQYNGFTVGSSHSNQLKIYADVPYTPAVSNSRISGNAGANISDVHSITISNIMFKDCKGDGIYVETASNIRIISNRICYNSNSGIAVNDAPGMIISRNDVWSNGSGADWVFKSIYAGVFFWTNGDGSHDSQILYNRIHHNPDNLKVDRDPYNVDIAYNSLYNSQNSNGYNLFVGGGSHNRIRHNICREPWFTGRNMMFNWSYSNTITSNVMNASDSGIRFESGWYNMVYRNAMTNNGLGVFMYRNPTVNGSPLGTNNYIYDNTIIATNGSGYGVYIDNGPKNQIWSNEIAGYANGIYAGIGTNGGDYTSIRSNIIRDCSSSGILLQDADNCIIIGNLITDNGTNDTSAGIRFLYKNNNCEIVNNIITYNSNNGIVFSGTNNYIAHNQISDNQNRGINIQPDSISNTITSNSINDGGYGIALERATYHNTIFSNSINNFSSAGIYFTYGVGSASSNRIDSCQIYNSTAGIHIIGCRENTITNCLISGSSQDGIKLDIADYNQIKGCIIENNSQNGIHFGTSSSNNYILDTDILQNGVRGILFSGSGSHYNNLVQNCDIATNDDTGILFNGVAATRQYNNIIRDCNIYSNHNMGIQLDYSLNHIISNCYIYDNTDSGILINAYSTNSHIKQSKSINNLIGVYIANSSTSTLYRVAAYFNDERGVLIDNDSDNNILLHLSVVSNSQIGVVDGIRIANNSTGNKVINSIMAYNNGYGVSKDAASSVIISHCDLYGNSSGPTNGGPDYQSGNILTQPLMIDYDQTSANFLGLSNVSPCVDTGSNIGFTYTGGNPDMGWIESPYTMNMGPFFVNDSGNNNNPGTLTQPYRTIQHAVRRMHRAVNVTVASCYVLPGRYQEKVVISTNLNPGFMVFAHYSNAQPDPVLDGSFISNTGIIISNIRDVYLKGIQIQGFTNGIRLTGSTNCYIDDCQILTNGIGLFMYQSISNIVVSNDFARNTNYIGDATAIYLSSGANNNFIGDNTFRDQDKGIMSGTGVSRNNSVSNNTFVLCQQGGMRLELARQYRIVDNDFLRCDTVQTTWNGGIYLKGSVISNYVINNVFRTNHVGIRLDWGTNNTIINNTIGTNLESGIYSEGQPLGNLIKRNICYNAKWNGIKFFGTSGSNLIMSNRCYNNVNGIELKPATNLYLIGNTCTNNNDKGVYINNGYDLYIKNNKCYDNTSTGIYVEDESHDLYISQNRCSGSSDGLFIQGNNHRIYTNYAVLNSGEGITIDTHATNTRLIGNYCMTNTGYGIYLNGANVTSSTLINNTCTTNYVGIFINQGDNNYLYNNLCNLNYYNGANWNTGIGIFSENSSDNTIFSNQLLDNERSGLYFNERNEDNIIRYNTVKGRHQWAGMNLKLVDSKVYTNYSYRNMDGIKIEGNSTNTLLIGNICSTNTAWGIVIQGSGVTASTLINNLCYSNANGIYLLSSKESYLYNNTINGYQTNGDGIKLESTKDNKVIFNSILNHNTGLVFNAASNNFVFNNTLLSNNRDGLYFDNNSCYNIIQKNDVSYMNRAYGINFISDGQSDYNVIQDNSIHNINSYAIGITGNNNNNIIYKNLLYRNTGDQINVANTALNNVINYNTVAFGGGAGVSVADNSTVIKNCIFYSNQNAGIYGSGSGPTVTYCLMYGNNSPFANSAVPGTGCITNQDPLFKDITAGSEDFHLQWNSPAQFAAEPVNNVSPAMGGHPVCVAPSIVGSDSPARHEIIFVNSYSNYGLGASDVIHIYYQRWNGGSSDFKLSNVTNADTTGAWGATFNSLGGSGSQIIEPVLAGANSTAGQPENVILTTVTNDGESTNRIYFYIRETTPGRTNIFPDYSNDFRIYSPTVFYVNDASTSGDIYTDGPGSDITGTGTKEKPYLTVSKVIDNYNVSAGNTIWIDHGDYSDQISLGNNDKGDIGDPILLIGAGTNSGSRSRINAPDYYYALYCLSTRAIKAIGLDLVNSTNGFGAVNATNIDMEFCNIASNDQYGAYLGGTSQDVNMFSNYIFLNDDNGVNIQGPNTTSITLINNVIYKNGLSDGVSGIRLQSADNNIIKNNVIYSNYDHGIYLGSDSEYNFIINNNIRGYSRAGTFNMMLVADCQNNQVLSNNIFSGTNGIYLLENSNNYLAYNHVHNHLSDGILLARAKLNRLFNNYCSTNRTGIKFYYCTNNTATNNVIFSNRVYGIQVDNGNHNKMINNTVTNNRDHNITLVGLYHVVRTNIVSFSKADGIYLGNVTGCTVENNICYKNNFDGVKLGNQAKGNRVLNNACFSNTDSGISLTATTNNYISGNRCYGQQEGIGQYASFVTGNTIVNNIVFQNQYGIELADDGSGSWHTYNLIRKNLCYSNRQSGIRVYNQVYNNSIISNIVHSQVSNDGIKVESGGNNVVASNLVYYNTNGAGITVYNISSSDIYNNICYSNKFGFYMQYNNNNDIFNNDVYNNRFDGEGIGIRVIQSSNNTIYSNTVYENTGRGLYMSICFSNNIYGNNIYQNNSDGLYLEQCDDNDINYNRVNRNNNQNGLHLVNNSENNRIKQNFILTNVDNHGILVDTSADYNVFISNVIAYNRYGVQINNSTTCTLIRNAVYHNDRHGLYLVNGDNNYIVNNSLSSNAIQNGYNSIDLDSDCSGNRLINNIVAFARDGSAYEVNDDNASGNLYKYNDVYNPGGNNYNGPTPDSTSISQDPQWLGYDIYSTNFLYLAETSPCIDIGTNIGLVYAGSAPDMGWKEFLRPYLRLTITKSVSNVTLAGSDNSAVPGATILYKIEYRLIGTKEATNLIIYDQLPVYVNYHTNYQGTATGWTSQYSTNTSPSQVYLSTDYTNEYSAKTNVKWIRWRKPAETPSTAKTFFYKVIIK